MTATSALAWRGGGELLVEGRDHLKLRKLSRDEPHFAPAA